MKLEPVTKHGKRNKRTSEKFNYNVLPENCDIVVIFSISGQFGAIRKPDSGRIVSKTYFFINNKLSPYKY